MKITIEGWKEEPFTLDDVDQFIISTFTTKGQHAINIYGTIQHECYLLKLLEILIAQNIKTDPRYAVNKCN
jgi:hypothetical protein